jgi:hypothetical protein
MDLKCGLALESARISNAIFLGDGMGDFFQPWHLMVLFVVAGIMLLPVILYILTLQKVLNKCAPGSRTLDPGMVWLLIVPFVNLIFNFFVVFGLAKTLGNEFRRRGTPVADPTPGQTIGLAMCICFACGIIPVLGLLASVAGTVLWIIYWLKISEYSRALDSQMQAYIPPPTM